MIISRRAFLATTGCTTLAALGGATPAHAAMRGIDHPVIVSESGRATAAHHSVLIFNTLGSSALDQFRITGRIEDDYQRL